MALKTEIESAIATGIDYVNRRIYFGRYLHTAGEIANGDFDSISVEYAVRALQIMTQDNSKRPIEIHMNSYGGDPYAMLYLYDLILASPCQIKFFGGGAIMSAASWILAACDERYLYPNTTVMVHKGNYGLSGNVTDNEIAVEEDRRLQAILDKVYANNSRMPAEFWNEVCKRDLFLTADEAIMLGLADKIIEPKKRGSFRKMRMSHLNSKIPHAKMKKTLAKLYQRIQLNLQPKEITLHGSVFEETDSSLTIDLNKENATNGTAGTVQPTTGPGTNIDPAIITGGNSTGVKRRRNPKLKGKKSRKRVNNLRRA